MEGMYAGSSGYHDFFGDPVPEDFHFLLGSGEASLFLDGDGDGEPSRIGYWELAVGAAVTRVVSDGPDGGHAQEISPVGAVLVGVVGAGPVTVKLYAGSTKTGEEHFVIGDGDEPF